MSKKRSIHETSLADSFASKNEKRLKSVADLTPIEEEPLSEQSFQTKLRENGIGIMETITNMQTRIALQRQ